MRHEKMRCVLIGFQILAGLLLISSCSSTQNLKPGELKKLCNEVRQGAQKKRVTVEGHLHVFHGDYIDIADAPGSKPGDPNPLVIIDGGKGPNAIEFSDRDYRIHASDGSIVGNGDKVRLTGDYVLRLDDCLLVVSTIERL